MTPVKCPDCGSPMVLRETTRFLYPKSGQPRRFYGCSKYPQCRATHGAHPNGNPCGIPGDASTKKARIEAHNVFDTLWKSGRMTRPQAYQVMQELMGLPESQAHIAMFNREQCSKLVSAILTQYPPLEMGQNIPDPSCKRPVEMKPTERFVS
jgi:ssDNA-binding Zn-finger/Zn-ribbon topoisomerase 1